MHGPDNSGDIIRYRKKQQPDQGNHKGDRHSGCLPKTLAFYREKPWVKPSQETAYSDLLRILEQPEQTFDSSFLIAANYFLSWHHKCGRSRTMWDILETDGVKSSSEEEEKEKCRCYQTITLPGTGAFLWTVTALDCLLWLLRVQNVSIWIVKSHVTICVKFSNPFEVINAKFVIKYLLDEHSMELLPNSYSWRESRQDLVRERRPSLLITASFLPNSYWVGFSKSFLLFSFFLALGGFSSDKVNNEENSRISKCS